MTAAKVAVTIDKELLREVDRWVRAGDFASRSSAFQQALLRLRAERSRRGSLLAELAKMDPTEEVKLAEEWLEQEVDWRRS